MSSKVLLAGLLAIVCAVSLVNSASPATSTAAASGSLLVPNRERVYYIAADEVDWDYAPTGTNQITGQPFDDVANVFVQPGPERIGRVYTKSLYREYTDATFGSRKPADPRWRHLGTLGPVIRGQVGDTIVVNFKNNTRFPASVHPHGVFYAKDSEGAGYNDQTGGTDKSDDAVPTGGTHVYHWNVPDRAGPGPHDGSSVVWMYHSHVDEPGDTNAGLLGAIIITGRGLARDDGSPVDVTAEFVTVFTVSDENESPYLDHNMRNLAGDHQALKADEEFHESNLMHSVNGYVFGNVPYLITKAGGITRWYTLGVGTEVDLHTPHWHGQTGLMMGMRTDMLELLPGSMKVFDMMPDNPGIWLLHCHVNDHIKAGMLARFAVVP